MTNAATTRDAPSRRSAAAATAQKVVIVNGTPEILDLLETVLDAGHYDVVFVESSEHAYSQIKRVQPNLVILCVRIAEADGFQVLSMLKLDEETREIPGAHLHDRIRRPGNGRRSSRDGRHRDVHGQARRVDELEGVIVAPHARRRTSAIPNGSRFSASCAARSWCSSRWRSGRSAAAGRRSKPAFPSSSIPFTISASPSATARSCQGARRPLQHHRRRPGGRALPFRHRVHRAARPRRRRDRRLHRRNHQRPPRAARTLHRFDFRYVARTATHFTFRCSR